MIEWVQEPVGVAAAVNEDQSSDTNLWWVLGGLVAFVAVAWTINHWEPAVRGAAS